ncbi:hypothetical protein H4R33_003227 [Dimargaris cristalligena]|nr:hypothetical protein H4R33_003227 [Dimargaris cristalligena]
MLESTTLSQDHPLDRIKQGLWEDKARVEGEAAHIAEHLRGQARQLSAKLAQAGEYLDHEAHRRFEDARAKVEAGDYLDGFPYLTTPAPEANHTDDPAGPAPAEPEPMPHPATGPPPTAATCVPRPAIGQLGCWLDRLGRHHIPGYGYIFADVPRGMNVVDNTGSGSGTITTDLPYCPCSDSSDHHQPPEEMQPPPPTAVPMAQVEEEPVESNFLPPLTKGADYLADRIFRDHDYRAKAEDEAEKGWRRLNDLWSSYRSHSEPQRYYQQLKTQLEDQYEQLTAHAGAKQQQIKDKMNRVTEKVGEEAAYIATNPISKATSKIPTLNSRPEGLVIPVSGFYAAILTIFVFILARRLAQYRRRLRRRRQNLHGAIGRVVSSDLMDLSSGPAQHTRSREHESEKTASHSDCPDSRLLEHETEVDLPLVQASVAFDRHFEKLLMCLVTLGHYTAVAPLASLLLCFMEANHYAAPLLHILYGGLVAAAAAVSTVKEETAMTEYHREGRSQLGKMTLGAPAWGKFLSTSVLASAMFSTMYTLLTGRPWWEAAAT